MSTERDPAILDRLLGTQTNCAGGYTWIAKSAATWCEETALTPKQYENAVARLRALDLVVTEQHWSAARSSRTCGSRRPGGRCSAPGPP